MAKFYLLLSTALLAIFSPSAFAQITNYSRTGLTAQPYDSIIGGTVINSTAQLSAGQSHSADDGSVLVALPFTFNYNNSNFNQVTFCTNGWIAMGDQTMSVTAMQSRTPGNLFNNSLPNNTIAAWFKDGSANFPAPGGAGSMVHGLTGTDIYSFEWRKATGSGFNLTTSNLISFMIRLYGPVSSNPGRIEILYGTQTGTLSYQASIGIEDGVGGTGNYINALDPQGNPSILANAWPGYGNGWRFDPPVPCTGAPTGGTTTSSNTTVCGNNAFTLSVSNSSTGSGLTYQWQTSADGTSWTNVQGQTGATYNVSGINSATYFRRQISCGTNTQYSSALQINLNSSISCYCSPATGITLHSSVGSPAIHNVTIAGTPLNNSNAGAPANGYTQFPSSGNTTAVLMQGSIYTLNTTFSSTGISSVWFDWNRNGIYETSEWQQIATSGTGGITSINVPTSASLGLTGMRIRLRSSGNVNGAADACTTFGSGETEEYLLNIVSAQPCSGTPSAGSASAPSSVCAGANFIVTSTGFSTGTGLTFQWQKTVPAQNSWSDISGATNYQLNTTQLSSTEYRLAVTCGNSTAFSSPVTVTVLTSGCPPVNDEPCNAEILTVNSDDNCTSKLTGSTWGSTQSNGYGYTNPVGCGTSATVRDVWYRVTTSASGAGSTGINFKLTRPNGSAMSTANLVLFSMTGSCPSPVLSYVNTACANSNNFSVLNMSAANLAPSTTYYLRVSLASSYDVAGTFEICATMAPAPCSGSPAAGNTISTNNSVCFGAPFTLSVTNATYASGLIYQWQTSADGVTYTDITGQTSSTYNVSQGIGSETFFRRAITCSTTTAYSAPLKITLNSASLCYCNPANGTTLHTQPGDPFIQSVSISGTILNNSNTNYPLNGFTQYGNSGNTTASLQQGNSYTLNTVFSSAASGSVWIDWNKNGSYEPSEYIQITANATGGTTNIVVPLNAVPGLTGLRIRTRLSANPNGPSDACTQFSSGETEEYLVAITAAQACSGTPTAGTVSGPQAACYGSNFSLAVNGFTVASGITFQWQSSPSAQNVWSNISGANGSSVITTQTSATDYRVLVSCNGGTAVVSNILSVSMQTTNCPPANDEPCGATTLLISPDNTCSNKLTGTTIGATTSVVSGYSNPVGCSIATSPKDVWYKVVTNASGAGSTNVVFKISKVTGSAMTTANLTLFKATGNCPSPTLTLVNNACLNVTSGLATSSMSVSFLSPNTVYYLRVNPYYSSDATGTFDICASVPPPGPSCATYISPASNAIVPVNQYVVFQWSPVAGASSYTHYVGTTYPPTTIQQISSATKDSAKFSLYATKYYWYVIPKDANGNAVGCIVDSFTTVAPPANCVPVTSSGCGIGDTLKLFTLRGEAGSQINQPSLCAQGAYTNYTATSAVTLGRGKAYNGSFIATDLKDYATIWIDFNDDGIFTNNERLLNNLKSSSKTTPTPFLINIPSSAAFGTHRLRIRMIYSTSIPVPPTDACSQYAFSETEDYSVTIISPPQPPLVSMGALNSCLTVGGLTIDESTNNNADLINIIDADNYVIASINANGNNLGTINSSVYINSGAVRTTSNGIKLLDRNVSIKPEFQPTTPVTVRVYFRQQELLALQNADQSITGRESLGASDVSDDCSTAGTPTLSAPGSQSANGEYEGDHYIEFVTTNLADFYLHKTTGVVPVTLLYFKGERNGATNILRWKTETEVNNAGFELQHSADGINFTRQAFVNSHAPNGNSVVALDYILTDQKPFSGETYYRLKQIDKDGRYVYSNIVLIKGNRATIVSIKGIYPNPASDKINVTVSAPASDIIKMIITDVTGKVVKEDVVSISEGDNNQVIDIRKLASGTYFLKAICTGGCENAVSRFVKH